MRRQDGQARALYRLLTMPILAALKNADVVQAEGEEGGKEEAQYGKDLLMAPPSAGGMTHTLNRFIQQMLLALFNGFSAWELVYWVPKTGPNKGKITLRKIDWRPSETLTFLLDGQGEHNGFRQRCYTYDVEVLQLNGTSVPIGEMAERHARGEVQWVYSCTEDGKVVPGKVADARKTSDSEPLVEVELDNGEKVRCTLTHPWMLRDGTYKRAANLKPGDSLMPLYRRYVRPSEGAAEYEQVWHPGTGESRGRWEYTHRMVSRNLGFGAGRGQVIHHWFDGLLQKNNDPRNLQRMTKAEHSQLHKDLGGNIARAHAEFRALSAEERSRIGSERARTRWANPVYREKTIARLRESWDRGRVEHPEWGNHSAVTFRDIDRVARAVVAAGKSLYKRTVWEKLGCSQDVVDDRIWDAGYESWKAYKWTLVQRDKKWERKQAGLGDGRRVPVTFRDIDQVAREIAETGRVFGWRDVAESLGCDQTVLYTRIRAEGFEGWKDYKASLTLNHKVIAVCPVPAEAVYDIEVEDHHNFALKAGVFVSNTFFQGRTIDVKIPKETSLYYACNEAERPFYGVSMFEAAFYHYDKKIKLEYIAHLAAQRAACGLRVGTMKPNPNKADKDNFTKALSNLGLAQYIVVPDADWTVVNLKEEGNFDFLGLINFHNSQMSKSVLAAWFDEAQGSGQGDSALVDFGNQDDATWLMMLDSILGEMKEIIDHHLLPRFIDWNFGTGLYPQFKWGELTAEQKAAIQDTFDKLAVAGQTANVTPEFMLELEQKMAEALGLDIDYDKIKKDREKQQKLMAQQAQAQMNQPVMAGNSAGLPGAPPAPGGGGGSQPGAPQGGPPQSSAGAGARTGPGGPYS